MPRIYPEYSDAFDNIVKAQEAMAFSPRDLFRVEPFNGLYTDKPLGYVIAMYSQRGNFCGFY